MRSMRWIGLVTLLLFTLARSVSGAPHSPSALGARPGPLRSSSIIDNTAHMDANNLDMVVTNHGSLAYDLNTGNAGLIYPKGSSRTAVFAAGPWIGAKVGGQFRVALGAYTQEFVPGPMAGGTYQPDAFAFHSYTIFRGNTTSSDYLNWPVDQGAPVGELGSPLLLGDATTWSVFNDADPSMHTNSAGATSPLGVELQQTVFAFDRVGALGNTIFVKWRILNKGANQLDSMYVAMWVDPDLGDYADDLVGCDTTLSLGYCYNASNSDAQYGSSPPAVGFAMLRGPVIPVSAGVYDTLGATAFTKQFNGADPADATEAYNAMRGLRIDGTPMHVSDDGLQPITTYEDSGDPVADTGWMDSNPGDRRFLLATGPFAFAPGDTQEVFFAICVGQGVDRLSSVTDLRQKVESVRTAPTDPTTSVSATVLEMDARPDRVQILWEVPGAVASTATVFRREEGGAWIYLGPAIPDGGSRIRFEDATVEPGVRYAYRLVVRETTGDENSFEAWVDVPAEAAPAAASLRFRAANPTSGQVAIEFGLPTAGPARLEVYDVRGARVVTLTKNETTAGWHTVGWDGRDAGGNKVASGVYFLRLETRGGVVVRKLAVAR